MSGHTPGPWHASSVSIVVGSLISKQGFGNVGAAFPRETTEICAANARLIAAAPELLEACQRALAIEESVTQGQEAKLREGFVGMVRSAIAMATGVEQ